MKKSEALRLVAKLALAFPASKFPAESQAIFADSLADLDFEPTAAGIADLLAVATRLPSVAELRAASRARSSSESAEGWAEAWTEAMRQTQSRGRNRAFESTCKITAETVAAIGWKELCGAETKTLATWRAQFRDIWNAKADAKKRAASIHRGPALPPMQEARALPPPRSEPDSGELVSAEEARALIGDIGRKLGVDG